VPVALTFLRAELRETVRIATIVALADAESFSPDFFASRATLNQLRYADFIVLNKCDVVTAERAVAVEDEIKAIADGARILRATRAAIPLPLILDIAALDQVVRQIAKGDGDHIAADGFQAVSFQSARPFIGDKFQTFLEQLSTYFVRKAYGGRR
jgi:G3E family GTPase